MRVVPYAAMAGCFLLPAVAVAGAGAQRKEVNRDHAIAFKRASALTHGVNLSGWFGGGGTIHQSTLRPISPRLISS